MQLNALLAGSIKELGTSGIKSGIDKKPVFHPLYLSRTGFHSDMKADLKNHGGPEKAVYHYPFEHYAFWRQTIGPLALLEQPGAFGENLSTTGIMETDVAIGDTFRLGGAVIAVSQPRPPCPKLNIRFDRADMGKRFYQTIRTGWYYSVVEEGTVHPDDELVFLERPMSDWPLLRIWHALYGDRMNAGDLNEIVNLPLLPQEIRQIAAICLETRKTQTWNERFPGKNSDTCQLPL